VQESRKLAGLVIREFKDCLCILFRAFFTAWGKGPMPYNFGENSMFSSLKGNEKPLCEVTFWGKLHDFKEIF
jgi:hypothetical protein